METEGKNGPTREFCLWRKNDSIDRSVIWATCSCIVIKSGTQPGRDWSMHTDLSEFLAVAFHHLLLCNNNDAIVLFGNPAFHSTSKHTHIKYKFLYEHANIGEAYLPYILFHDNIPNNFMQALNFQVLHLLLHHYGTSGLQWRKLGRVNLFSLSLLFISPAYSTYMYWGYLYSNPHQVHYVSHVHFPTLPYLFILNVEVDCIYFQWKSLVKVV